MRLAGSEDPSKSGAEAVGFVWIFNMTSQRIRPTLNGNQLDHINPLPTAGGQPDGIPVQRVNSQTTQEARFAEKSDLRIRYLASGGKSFESVVEIPRRDAPLRDDLQLVVWHGFIFVTWNGLLIFHDEDPLERAIHVQ